MKKDNNHIYPIRLIHASIGNEVSPTPSVLLSGQMRCLMLYCLQDMGNDQFLPLNRDYKPLGILKTDFVKYEDYNFLFIPKSLINFTLFWDNGITFGRQGYYTFSDGTYPRNAKLFRRYRTIIFGAFFGMNQFNTEEMFKKIWENKQNINEDDRIANFDKFSTQNQSVLAMDKFHFIERT